MTARWPMRDECAAAIICKTMTETPSAAITLTDKPPARSASFLQDQQELGAACGWGARGGLLRLSVALASTLKDRRHASRSRSLGDRRQDQHAVRFGSESITSKAPRAGFCVKQPNVCSLWRLPRFRFAKTRKSRRQRLNPAHNWLVPGSGRESAGRPGHRSRARHKVDHVDPESRHSPETNAARRSARVHRGPVTGPRTGVEADRPTMAIAAPRRRPGVVATA